MSDLPSHGQSDSERGLDPGHVTGILLAQMGGPEGPEDVGPFIRSIFADPAMVALPGGRAFRKILATLVSRLRAPAVRRRYELIGGGSPIGRITRGQADRLVEELARRGHDARVAVAMRYTKPDTRSAVEELLAAGVDNIVLLPLYPQYCGATTGSSRLEAERIHLENAGAPPLQVVVDWYQDEGYLDLSAQLVAMALEQIPQDSRLGAHVLFSAHGIPQRLADSGDPYPAQVEATAEAVSLRLRSMGFDLRTLIGYQSRTGPVKWLGPDTFETVRQLGGEGVRDLVVVPISFVSDHIETLFELDVDLREVAEKAGIENMVRSPVMNDMPGVGTLLANIVEPYLGNRRTT